MTADSLGVIPADRREAARAALREVFGAAAIADLRPIVGGVSALSYRVAVGERAYVLRLDARRGGMSDPRRGYAAMRLAAEAGVAPPVRHADPEAGVAIVDFVTPQPLAAYPGGPMRLAHDLGRLIARLQAAPAFPALGDYPVILERMLAFIGASGVVAAGLLEPHAAGLARIRAACPWDAAGLVASHNDPNPRNILFDGRRLWLVDWETAFRNDPLVDIAIAMNESAPTDELQAALLTGWLGREADAALRARLMLVRQFTRLWYGCLILSAFAGAARGQPITDLGAPTPEAFREAAERGELQWAAPETALLLGKVYLAEFLKGLNAACFQEALATAAGD